MSYDITLERNGATVELAAPHDKRGGTYAMGGTTEAWLNVTYNYAPHFYRVFGEKGIRTIYGMTADASIPVLVEAIRKLGTDVAPDYWQGTEGNARQALKDLLWLAIEAPPDAIWNGD